MPQRCANGVIIMVLIVEKDMCAQIIKEMRKSFLKKEKDITRKLRGNTMAGKTRPCLRKKVLDNLARSNLSRTDRDCIVNVFEKYEQLLIEKEQMVQAIKCMTSDGNICEFCSNKVKCESKKCEKYCEGKGGWGENGQHFPDWKWSCEDFDFGTCPLLENTPCNGCFENDYSGFEFKTIEVEMDI